MNMIDELQREQAHADQMAAMAQLWMRRALDAERTLAHVVAAAGGKVEVPRDTLLSEPTFETLNEYRIHDMMSVFRTIPKPAEPCTTSTV